MVLLLLTLNIVFFPFLNLNKQIPVGDLCLIYVTLIAEAEIKTTLF